jgi:hypothetical protein
MISDGSGEMKQDLIAIRTFMNESEATIARSALEAFGIECVFGRDDCGGMRPSLTMSEGIRLLVRPADAGRAEEVLTIEPEDAD